ncbi:MULTISPECIES: hypothetical protein [Pseudomonas]|uniref:hypothetical protein n=1 Tax=Pseudomonas TaxID=286 RepID=UPI001179A485|nr:MULTISPECIES: hypothetical protein [Pseudomonas]HEK0905495.1 hypothetical protein [Pseudomonas putida]
MSTNHRCICATCSREMKPGQDVASIESYYKLAIERNQSPGKPPNVSRAWGDRLLEWAKVIVKFGYLLLAFFKL